MDSIATTIHWILVFFYLPGTANEKITIPEKQRETEAYRMDLTSQGGCLGRVGLVAGKVPRDRTTTADRVSCRRESWIPISISEQWV